MRKFIYLLGLVILIACNNQPAETKDMVDNSKVVENSKAIFKVEGMVCGVGCAPKIEKAINSLSGISSVKAVYEKKVAFVSYDSTMVTKAQMIAAINAIDGGKSYTATEMSLEECRILCSADSTKCAHASKDHVCSETCKKDGCSAKKACANDCKKECCTKKKTCSPEEKKECAKKHKSCASDCKKECCVKK